jgi:hypothetical protein
LKLRSKMTCSWSLERDRSERIGLRGCRVTGWGENRKTRGTRSNRVWDPVRPPPAADSAGCDPGLGFDSFFHIGPWDA